ncbi:MAG: TlpA disulfide reductase family protein [Actinomycetota bacterium]|nr:TlpA disulfide reductase family protein [Actinomycetota bacterium]
MSRVRVVALVVGAIVVAFGVVLALNVDSGSPTTDGGFVGKRPDYSVRTLDGDLLASDELVGKTVVVNFWNTWCIPCIDEAPALDAFYEEHKDDPDLVFLGVVRDDTESAVTAYVTEYDVGWQIAMDPDSRTALSFGVTGQPETFVVGPDGVVAAEQRFRVSVEDLEAMVQAAGGGTS